MSHDAQARRGDPPPPPPPPAPMGDDTPAGEKPHAVCVGFPAQGHLTPILKLAKILHCGGFHVTFVNTEYNHRRLVRARGAGAVAGLPGFRFATIPDGLPPSDADATQDPASISYSTMTTCLPHLRALLAELNRSPGVPPVTCVVADNLMSFSLDAARELGVPCALFWTASACGYMGYRSYRLFMEKGLFPLQGEEQLTNGFLDTPVDWAHGMSKHMRIGDFPSFFRSTYHDDTLFRFQLREVERASAASAVILNTFDELEQPAIDAMHAVLPLLYTIGPLNLHTKQLVPDGAPVDALSTNLWKEDNACLNWLDARNPRSVVYVNFGSVTVMSNQELVEFAAGLIDSSYEFLWIIRPDLVRGDNAILPPEFLETTKSRGFLASWCPQEVVLRHEAVGVFLTHSGWNSTLESLCGGVPMLCWPFFAEQQTNTRYSCVEWGVAMEVGNNVRRDAVEGRIREAMAGEKGKEMRRRVMEWKEAAVRATQPGGRSHANLAKIVGDVLLSAHCCKNQP